MKFYKRIDTGIISCLAIKPVNGDSSGNVLWRGELTRLSDEWITGISDWTIICSFPPGSFKTGIYEFTPYLIIVQDDLPQELIESLGSDAYGFNPNYFKIPFKQTPGLLKVSEL